MIENQLKIGQTDIPNIEIDLKCRDEIPQVLFGLQQIYSNPATRNKMFNILEGITPVDVAADRGRPGMDLWKILVLGALRVNCNWDYDKLHNIANEHKTIREFLSHTIYDFHQTYGLQTLKDNISLLTPKLLDKINQLIVHIGHSLFNKRQPDVLKGRCDSFVVETDVHYPTDINLLLDAVRKSIFLVAYLCEDYGITEWRQYKHIFRKIKKQFNWVRKIKRSSSNKEELKAKRKQLIKDAHIQYTDMVEMYINRSKETIAILHQMGICPFWRFETIKYYVAHAERQIDQIRRRVLNDEKIPHGEKVFSIFEEHT